MTLELKEYLKTINGLLTDSVLPWEVARSIASLLQLDDFVVYIREGNSLVQAAAVGVKTLGHELIVDPITIPLGHAIVGKCGVTREPVYVPDVAKVAGYVPDHFDGQSEFCVPVLLGEELVAVFDSECSQPHGYTEEQRSNMMLMATASAAPIKLWKQTRDTTQQKEQTRGRHARALGTFASAVAHDLNNLLTVTELTAELLGSHSLTDRQAQTSLNRVVQRARGLTAQLLSLTTSGPTSLEIIDIENVFAEIVAASQKWSNIKLVVNVANDAPLLRADPSQLPRIVMNLVSNALDAIGEREGTVRISARLADTRETAILIQVSDDGRGIEPDVLGEIFDPYFTTKKEGLGLGLASAYWSALQHNGNLTVRSVPGEGSTFSLILPAQSGRIVQSPPKKAELDALNILVLDDDDMVAELLSRVLLDLGHQCTVVNRGEQVVPTWGAALAAGTPFDIALLDLKNDLGQGGIETVMRLRRSYADARAIAMSGFSAEILADAQRAGFQATVSKPFQVDELTKTLVRVLGHNDSA